MNNDNWYKLDNAAKIFPPTTDKNDPQVFRFAVALKDLVDKNILQRALDITIEDYPIFRSTLRKGFFWYYLEEIDVKPVVTEEKFLPCEFIYGELLCRVSYYKKRINLEVHHSLTDGTGTLLFLRSLVANYLNIKYDIKEIEILDTSSSYSKAIDGFKKYYKVEAKKKKDKVKRAYRVKGAVYPEDRIKIIEGVCSVSKLLNIAKDNNTTLTVYLTSVLIKALLEDMTLKERRHKEIVIQVPVNLRKYFPSDTVRNFFNVINVRYKCISDDIEFSDIINSVNKQFKESLTKDRLSRNMNSYAVLENILVVRVIPRIIKDIILKYVYKFTKKYHTMTLSNVGIVSMPKIYSKYIDLFDVFTSTDGMQCCCCSYLDNLVISFTSHFKNTNIESNFFRELSKNGSEIVINTNNIEGEDNEEVL